MSLFFVLLFVPNSQLLKIPYGARGVRTVVPMEERISKSTAGTPPPGAAFGILVLWEGRLVCIPVTMDDNTPAHQLNCIAPLL